MTKVHSLVSIATADASCSSYMTPKREALTVWMKSLVMQGNGCTVFDQNGQIVYRIDNYEKKGSRKVFLMDLRGKVLFTIIQRKLRVLGRWEGYKCDEQDVKDGKLWFRVKRGCPIFKRKSSCQVSVHCDKGQHTFNIESVAGKSEFRIVERTGGLIAEGKRKQSSSGVYLGDDVLTLFVEPEVDQSLVVALVAVYGSMHRRM
ncbi:protein LURP-one-related 11-like [Rhodamnia argentea]|uniref:Protein LURP-one-related 11-like n=1 Tax=Rhodamnia argentea TaxID=178133 RepID=A0A8B8QZE4_9MYRT|nr:protein LURP-one-related 11-like [Rhodamnia argentea]